MDLVHYRERNDRGHSELARCTAAAERLGRLFQRDGFRRFERVVPERRQDQSCLWFAPGEGGGVSQTFTTTGGLATFSADIAAFTRVNGLTAFGLMSVLLDGVVLDSFDFVGPGTSTTLRNTLDFTTNLTAGQHTIQLQATRIFAPGGGVTSQYFDNVSLDVEAAVPEPSTWAMLILGFVGVGFIAYRRRNGATLAA